MNFRVHTIAHTLGLFGAFAGFAGDEQWDDRIPDTGHFYNKLALYKGAVYGSRFKWDGSNLSEWTAGCAGLVKTVRANDLFVSGTASSMCGLPAGVSRWDGTAWHEVGHGITVSDFGNRVAALVFHGNELFAGGQELDGGGASVLTGIARLDGADWVSVGGGLLLFPHDEEPGNAWDITTKNGVLYVVGEFHRAGNIAATNVASWDGTKWSAIGAGPTSYQVEFQRETLYVTSASGLHRWDGTNWMIDAIVNGNIHALTTTEREIYIGGTFNSVNGVAATNIARWDGTNWWALGSGITGAAVFDILVWKNQVVVSGEFSAAGGKPSRNFAVWHRPQVDISRAGNQIEVTWWKGFTNYVLECSTDLPGANWNRVTTSPGTNYYAAAAVGTNKFFRLRQE